MTNTAVIVVADRVIQIAALAILARLISPHDTGIATGASAVVSAFYMVGSLGIPAGLIQITNIDAKAQAVARATLLVTMTIAFAGLQIAAPLFGQWFNSAEVAQAVRVMAFVLVVQPVAAVATAHLTRALKASRVALVDVVSNFLGLTLVMVPLALMHKGYWALIYGAIAQISFRAALLVLVVRQVPHFSFSGDRAFDLARRSVGFMVNDCLQRGEHDGPRWVVGHYLTGPALGVFARAHSLMNYPSSLFRAVVDRIIFPAMALVQQEESRLRGGVLEAVRATAVAGLPLTAALVILGPDIILLVLGPDWRGAIEPFRILGLATFFQLSDRLNGVVLRGVGKTGQLAAVQAGLLVPLLLGCAFGAGLFGLAGVATAVLATSALNYAIGSLVAMRAAKVGFGDWFRAHLPGLCASVLAAAVLWPLKRLLDAAHMHSFAHILFSALASAVVGGVAFWIAPRFFLGEAACGLLGSIVTTGLRRLRSKFAPAKH